MHDMAFATVVQLPCMIACPIAVTWKHVYDCSKEQLQQDKALQACSYALPLQVYEYQCCVG